MCSKKPPPVKEPEEKFSEAELIRARERKENSEYISGGRSGTSKLTIDLLKTISSDSALKI